MGAAGRCLAGVGGVGCEAWVGSYPVVGREGRVGGHFAKVVSTERTSAAAVSRSSSVR